MGISTISSIVNEVCDFIWKHLNTEFMGIPSGEKWEEISMEFEVRANFPNCIGAVDGKHVRIIIKPIRSGSICFNYKHFFFYSLVGNL